jgi:hypothetical protein
MYKMPAKEEKKSRVIANLIASGTSPRKKNITTPVTTMIIPVWVFVFNSFLTSCRRFLKEFPSSRTTADFVIGKHMLTENAHTAGKT